MDDETIDPNDPGFLDVTRRLEAYADERLSPTAAASARMRTNVMSAAHRRAALTDANATHDATGLATTAPTAHRASAARSRWRRPIAAVLAASLTLVLLAGTASAAKPGGPLYAARIWTEMTNLPADVVARAKAEVRRLDERLQEAQDGSTAGDGPATAAALLAYSTIVVEAATGSEGDPLASASIEVSVTRHVLVLTVMVDTVPEPARAAAEKALSATGTVLDDLHGTGMKRTDADSRGLADPVDS
jgi:hypothetical protein